MLNENVYKINSYSDFVPNSFLRQLGSQMTASVLGSSACVVALNPLSVLKVRLQSGIQRNSNSPILAISKDILRNNGIRGFWTGTSAGLAHIVPSSVIYMILYERIKKKLYEDTLPKSSPGYNRSIPGFAAAFARFISITCVAPVELVRTLRANGTPGSGVSIAWNIIKSEGVLGLYRGWLSYVLRSVPYSVIYWYNLERMKDIVFVDNPQSPYTNFVCGAVSASIATVATQPFDVLKTRQQTMNRSPAPSIADAHASGLCTCFSDLPKSIVSLRGIRCLYSGLSLRLMTAIPSGGLMIAVYEFTKNLLN